MKTLILATCLVFLASPLAFAQAGPGAIDVEEFKQLTEHEWAVLIQGKLNRSAVVALLGKPDVSMTGSLTFNNRVKDADTDQIHALNVMFLRGEHLPASYVGHLPNHDAGNAPPFVK